MEQKNCTQKIETTPACIITAPARCRWSCKATSQASIRAVGGCVESTSGRVPNARAMELCSSCRELHYSGTVDPTSGKTLQPRARDHYEFYKALRLMISHDDEDNPR